MLVLRELRIRLGPIIADILQRFRDSVLYTLTSAECKVIEQFYTRMQELDVALSRILQEFYFQVEREYRAIHHEIEETFVGKNSSAEQAQHSVKLAELCKVDEAKIMKNNQDLDNFFLG